MNILEFILKQFDLRKTFDSLRGGKLAFFGDLAAILKIKQKFSSVESITYTYLSPCKKRTSKVSYEGCKSLI